MKEPIDCRTCHGRSFVLSDDYEVISCESCHGTGYEAPNLIECEHCRGTGLVESPEKACNWDLESEPIKTLWESILERSEGRIRPSNGG